MIGDGVTLLRRERGWVPLGGYLEDILTSCNEAERGVGTLGKDTLTSCNEVFLGKEYTGGQPKYEFVIGVLPHREVLIGY
jgi:hypothetical protein